MPRWMRAGIIFSCTYLTLIFLFIIGMVSGIGGTGESNIFAWLLIFSVFPLAWLLSIVGIKIVISTNLYPLLFFQLVIVFSIGAILGLITSKRKTRRTQEN